MEIGRLFCDVMSRIMFFQMNISIFALFQDFALKRNERFLHNHLWIKQSLFEENSYLLI